MNAKDLNGFKINKMEKLKNGLRICRVEVVDDNNLNKLAV
jgi:hypothetical protein